MVTSRDDHATYRVEAGAVDAGGDFLPTTWDLAADVVVIFDPRLTEVYQVAGEPYSFQGGSGELTAIAVGASLWGLGIQILEGSDSIRTQRPIGTRYNYFVWDVQCPIFPLVRATGLKVKDWQNLILVNQLGQRFYDETKGDYPNGNMAHEFTPYTPNDYRNNARITYDPSRYNFFNAAVAMNEVSGPPDFAAGPVWAIFDANAVAREGWQVVPPYVDPDGYCFQADTLEALAAAITNPFQAGAMDGATLQATVARYNRFVDAGTDVDFGKPTPQYKIQHRHSTPLGPRRGCMTHGQACASMGSIRYWTCKVR